MDAPSGFDSVGSGRFRALLIIGLFGAGSEEEREESQAIVVVLEHWCCSSSCSCSCFCWDGGGKPSKRLSAIAVCERSLPSQMYLAVRQFEKLMIMFFLV